MLIRKQLANAIRFLAIDAVQKANSGHPGMPMGMADIAEVLWNDFLKFNPKNPNWLNRDRFILSNGHGCMLQYALLHLTGYDLSLDEIKNFRQLHSKTPGHPEFGETPGIETTTGPLGQGLANAVGMALAEKILAAHFNRDQFNLVDHYTYVFAGDGCLMEGLSHEVCSLAGTWGLDKLVLFFDDNGISIDGEIIGWCTTDIPVRFKSYGWHVISNVDGHDPEAVKKAIIEAQNEKQKPTIICCKTTIGFGAPNLAGSEKTHGSPLGEAEVIATRKALDWPHAAFEIPKETYHAFDATKKGAQLESEWQKQFDKYQKTHPELAQEFLRRMQGDLPNGFSGLLNEFLIESQAEFGAIATRKSSNHVIEKVTSLLPELIGGSADLTGSNLTSWKIMKTYEKDQSDANYIYYGVREFGMTAIMNGLALYGGFIPFGGTFLVFQSYCANATRMSALMKQRVIYIFTHDSIGLGEDGPTHQPVMEAATLRMTPNMTVWRPCDTAETVVAWQQAIEQQHGPTSLLLTRQTIPAQQRNEAQLNAIYRGGYVLKDCDAKPEIILIATGSEISLAMQVADELKDKNIRVVSMPSCEVFDAQDENYKESVLPSNVTARVAIEASASAYWYKYVGLKGKVLGLDRFGASAPAKDAFADCGFSAKHVIIAVDELLVETV